MRGLVHPGVSFVEGLNVQESLWECYLTDPESNPDPDTWRTELNRPLSE